MKALRTISLITLIAMVVMTAGTLRTFAQDEITLTFLSWQVDEAVGEWWRAAIEEFEATHPGVEIEFTKVGRDVYADTFLTLFAAGTPPDIVHLASFEFQRFAEEGWLEDLTPFIEQSGLDLEGWSGQEICNWKGTVPCILLQYFGFVMVYNEAMFEEAGLEVPTTPEAYMEAARLLTKDTDGDGITDQFGTSHHTTPGSQYMVEVDNYVFGLGGNWTNLDGEVTINTPEVIQALEMWKEVNQDRLTPLDLSSGEIRQMVIEGKIAMRLDGPWVWGSVQKAAPEILEQLKFAPVPFPIPVGGGSNVIAIPTDISAERQQLVWEFIELITSYDWQVEYGLTIGQPAPRPNTITDEYYEVLPHIDMLLEMQNIASENHIDRAPKGLEIYFNEFAKVVFDELQAMIIRDEDPAVVAERLHAAAEDLKNQ